MVELISNLTGYYTAMIGSSSDSAKVLRLEIVPIKDNEVVLLIVTDAGDVQHQKIFTAL